MQTSENQTDPNPFYKVGEALGEALGEDLRLKVFHGIVYALGLLKVAGEWAKNRLASLKLDQKNEVTEL